MLQEEVVLTLLEVTKALPSFNGKRLHVSSVWRWARRGVKGVKLETRRIGARYVTSMEALERFTKALSEIEPDSPTQRRAKHLPTPSERQRQRDIEVAQRSVDARLKRGNSGPKPSQDGTPE